MKVVGIIAEYNPFHNGHKFQIEYAKNTLHADYVVVIMNGDFMQRGEPALLNKHLRSKMAIQNGADLVLELPTLYGTASAEFFAYAGVRLLSQLSIVTDLCFGCETDNLSLLDKIATLCLQEPDEYKQELTMCLSSGMSFPSARTQAIIHCLSDNELIDTSILEQPNTILAIEYLKAIKICQSKLIPHICLRSDSGYHSQTIDQGYASASAIRQAMSSSNISTIQSVVPASVYEELTQAMTYTPLQMSDFYSDLQYCLWKPDQKLTEILDISEDLANRITKLYDPTMSYASLIEAVLNKQYTRTRIQRCMLHILLHISTDDMEQQRNAGTMHYARVLGVHKDSTALLKELKKHSTIPVIQRLAVDQHLLEDPLAISLLNMDLSASKYYEQHFSRKNHCSAPNEYQIGTIYE